MTYYLVLLTLAVAAALVSFVTRAVQTGHLLVLSTRGSDYLLLEQGADGRYTLLAWRYAPVALARFVAADVGAAWNALAVRAGRLAPGRSGRKVPRAKESTHAARV